MFRAFELKWNPKKANAAIPSAFMQAYPVAEAVVITPENYRPKGDCPWRADAAA